MTRTRVPVCPDDERIYGKVVVSGYMRNQDDGTVKVQAERILPGYHVDKKIYNVKSSSQNDMSQHDAELEASRIASKLDSLEGWWYAQRLKGRTPGASSRPKKRKTTAL